MSTVRLLGLLLVAMGVVVYVLNAAYQLAVRGAPASEALMPGVVAGGLLGLGGVVLVVALIAGRTSERPDR